MRRFLLWAALLPCAAQATVQYTISPDVTRGDIAVSIRLKNPHPSETLEIPGWSPGFYTMQHYESKISDVAAGDSDGDVFPVDHSETRSWTVRTKAGEDLKFTYRVKADDVGLGFFAANVQANSAYLNGPSTYMYDPSRREEECSLVVSVPQTWHIATALDQAADGTWTARNYDELADYPVQMGAFVERNFTVEGLPFRAVFVTPPNEAMRFDIDAQLPVIEKVSAPAIRMFGGAPFHRYLYIFHLTPLGFQGGLEHRSGTVIAVPNVAQDDLSDLVCHEEFHAWNVKQIRPKLLGPFDYTSPQRTGALWFAEGVTDYYAKVLTYRSGVHDAGWLFDELSDQVSSLQAGRTRLSKTVEDASRAAWENGGFNLGDLDYYNKGLLAGLIFDAEIRTVTGGKRSLDDVMRLLYKRYRLPQPGYDEDGILRAINEVAERDLTPLYNRIIRSTEEMPYADLKGLGMVVLSPNQSAELPGGWPLPSDGVPSDALNRIGLRSSDQFKGIRPTTGDGSVSFDIERDGASVRVDLPLKKVEVSRYFVIADPQSNPDAALRLSEWLSRPKAQ